MTSFDAFIKAIHSAILSANDALMDKNLDVLEKFFEESDGGSELQRTLDEALKATKDVAGEEGRSGRERLQRALEALEEARRSISHKDGSRVDRDQARFPDGLRPKMTTIQYPQQIADGVVMSEVKVPLITLVPLSMTQISEVKLRTELEIQLDDDELLVSFPAPQSGTPQDKGDDAQTSSRPSATLEITLTPHHGTEGLRKIVDGYEKVLRAQIPN
jgi:ElaB/YqjD/DUF883 family membrane-anchored ribosome-binding protein